MISTFHDSTVICDLCGLEFWWVFVCKTLMCARVHACTFVSVSLCVYECVGCVRMEEMFGHAAWWRYMHEQVTLLAKIVRNRNMCCHGRIPQCLYPT